jgi:hypothetical protein
VDDAAAGVASEAIAGSDGFVTGSRLLPAEVWAGDLDGDDGLSGSAQWVVSLSRPYVVNRAQIWGGVSVLLTVGDIGRRTWTGGSTVRSG